MKKTEVLPRGDAGSVARAVSSQNRGIMDVKDAACLEKFDQVFITHEDVEIILSAAQEEPKPNRKMLEAHKALRLMLS